MPHTRVHCATHASAKGVNCSACSNDIVFASACSFASASTLASASISVASSVACASTTVGVNKKVYVPSSLNDRSTVPASPFRPDFDGVRTETTR